MLVKEINVPLGIKYISEWKDFTFPPESCIIDKRICGCGFTEWCLNNDTPVILCSPRRVLLENKQEQHNAPGSTLRPVYYFKNDKESLLEFDEVIDEEAERKKAEIANTSSTNSIIELERWMCKKRKGNKDEIEYFNYIFALKSDLLNWINTGYVNLGPNFVPKIMVTYDSLKYVVEALGTNVDKFVIVVDEFQSIFTDSTFKPEVELNILDILSSLPNNKSLFISATPMMERYLDKLPYFQDMTIYKLNWDNSIIDQVRIERKYSNSIRNDIAEIILKYKAGVYPTKVTPDGVTHISKEAVFFVNSVNYIVDVVRKTGLKPEETNILCANTKQNLKRVKKIGHTIGKVPVNRADNKMFTFCTRTTYIGADFYSDCAMTFVFSDLNKQSLTVDISLDLPQIIGRQRLNTNVFRNEISFYYHLRNSDFFMTREDFDNWQKEKEQRTVDFINATAPMKDNPTLASMVQFYAKGKKYIDDYVGFSRRQNIPVENVLVKLSELRAWEITRPDYQETVLIKKTSNDPIPDNFTAVNVSSTDTDLVTILEFRKKFEATNEFVSRMKAFFDFYVNNPELYQKYNDQFISFIPVEYRNYLNKIGIERIRALNYNRKNIETEISYHRLMEEGTLPREIYKVFQPGMTVSRQYVKDTIGKIYSNLGYDNTAKATDLLNYFDVEECTWLDSSKKRIRGFKLINKK